MNDARRRATTERRGDPAAGPQVVDERVTVKRLANARRLSPRSLIHSKAAFLFALLILSTVIISYSAHAEPVIGTYASIAQSTVSIGELAVITIEPQPARQLAVSITDGTNTFRYNGASRSIGFQPQMAGEHRLHIRDARSGELLETLSFLVAEQTTTTIAPIEALASPESPTTAPATPPRAENEETVLPTRTHMISSDKQNYVLGEQVNISIAAGEPGLHLNIIYGEQLFRFLGETQSSVLFQPNEPGAYRVAVSSPQGAVIDSFVFTVHEQTTSAQPQSTPAAPSLNETAQQPGTDGFSSAFEATQQRFKVRDARNNPADGVIRILERGKQPVVRSMLDAQTEPLGGPADVEFEPSRGAIKHVRVSNLVASGLDLGIDDFTGTPTALPMGKDERKTAWSSLYAVDPTMLNATSVTVTLTATGSELYTCKDWDFANRACLGAWTKVRDLVPGENYTITMDPTDPGFGETISIPSAGWTQTNAGTAFTVRLCDSPSCANVTTVFQRGDTVYVLVNATPAYIRTTTKNQFDIYFGSDTGAIQSVTYPICTPASADGPYSFCTANFTIPETWADGWYYIDSQQLRSQGGGINTAWMTPFLVTTSSEQIGGESLKFFADSSYTIETEMFTTGQQVYVQFNISTPGQTATTTSAPIIRNFKTAPGGGGTAVTESFSNTTGPYRFNFSMPNLVTAGWYVFSPNLVNTSGGAIPEGAQVHGRLILFQSNTAPNITAVVTNTPPSAPRSIGEAINWTVNISDPDEIDRWVVYLCSNSSFNSATRTCGATTICSNGTYSRITNRTCQTTANSSMNTTSTSYAFACDARSCSSGVAISWAIVNDTTAPDVTLVTPINDPAGGLPRTSFTTTFNFVPSDNYRIANCTLYTNATGGWAATATNATITNGTNNYITHTFGADGAYKWNVLCADPAGNRDFAAANYTLYVNGPPIVSLISPANSSYLSSQAVTLSYNVTYRQNVSNCSLYLNGALNQTDTAITQGATESFAATFGTDGAYNWSVYCAGEDGLGSFSDGVYNAGTNRTFTVDTQIPNVTLQGPADGATITTASVSFVYSANDTARVANCSLYVDGVEVSTVLSPANNANQTVNFLLNNGNHPWYVTCSDAAANAVTSATRTVTVSSSSAGNAQFYETDYTTGNYAPPASVNLSSTVDGVQGAITASVPTRTMSIFSRAITTPFQGNGIIVMANSTVNFSGDFNINAVNSGYATWKLYKSNATSDTLICQSGDDNTGGTSLPSNGRQTGTGACTTPTSHTRLQGTEWIKLQVDLYNNNAKAKSMTHYIDSLSSYVIFNFTRLGVLTTSIVVPATNLTIGVNDTFQVTCAYNCSGGSCLNTRIYLERNTSSTGWQQIPASGGIIVLDPAETNPHSLGTTAFPGGTTTFTLVGNATGSASVRCNATSDHSSALVMDRRVINVGALSIPTVVLLSPTNNSFISTTDATLTFLPSSNKVLSSCSLYVDGLLNQTNATPAKDVTNQFMLYSLPEATYRWQVRCTDASGTTGNSSNYTLTVDRGPPTVDVNAPANYSNFTTDTVAFNWTAADSVATALRCNVTIDGTVRGLNINSPSGVPTATSIGGLGIGVHYWNVSCLDAAGNRNTSETRMFNITNLPTNVSLLSPANNYWTSAQPVVLAYNITHPLNWEPDNCSLYINGTLNMTNATQVQMNQSNSFSANTFTDGSYSWRVQCIDGDGTQNTSGTRTIYVDRTVPHINLTYPLNDSVLGIFNIPFTYNATDNLAPNMTCNLALDGSVNVSNSFVRNGRENITTIRNIADGVHTWNVSCTDLAGNANQSLLFTFTAIAPPNVTLVSPPNNGFSSSTTLTLTYNVSENNALRECRLYVDGAPNILNETPVANNNLNSFIINGVSQGLHNWSVSCTDTSGYMGNSSTRNITVDTILPAISINAPANASLLRTPVVVVNWTAFDDRDQSLLCNITRIGPDGTDTSKRNLAAANGTPTTATYSGLPDGLHRWSVACWDDALNTNYTETYQFNVSALPSVTLVSPANNNINNTGDITLAYVPLQSYGIASCSLILDDEINSTNTSIANGGNNYFYLQNAQQGSHNWSVNCTDNTGGVQNSTTWRFTLDLTAPYIGLNNPAHQSVEQNNTVAFSYTPTDTQSTSLTCNLTVNGTVYSPNQAVANGTTQLTSVLLRGGNASYLWNVTCRDSAYNYNTSESRQFNIIAPPTVRLVSPLNNTGTSPNTSFVFYASDPFGIQNCSLLLDGVVVNSSTSIANASNNNLSAYNIPEGGHTWTVQCYDNDNDTYTAAPYTVSSDFDPPNVTLNAPANDSLFQLGNATFNWTATDDTSPNMTCILYVDGTNRSTVTTVNNTPATASLSLLPDGQRLWNVSCRDLVGNPGTSETRQLTINQTPAISLGAPANATSTRNGTVMFTFTPFDNDGFASCAVIINGVPNTTNQTPVRNGMLNNITIDLETARYNWSVRCADNGTYALQNETVNRTLTVNLIRPVILLNEPPGGFVTNLSAITFNWTATETFGGALSCNLTINGTVRAPSVNSPSGVPTASTVSGLNDSHQVWNVTCTDPAGNVNTSETRAFEVTAPPAITLSAPANSLRTNNLTINFTFTPTDNSGLISACSLLLNGAVNRTILNPAHNVLTNITVPGFVNGSYSWSVNCTDLFGNMGNTTNRTLLIDTLPPNITLNAPANGTALGTNVTFNWTASDSGTLVTCNHTIDGVVNASNIVGVSGTPFVRLVPNVAEGPHSWNVTCWDDLGHTTTSVTYNFSVNAPDLVLNDTARIAFNNTNPDENDTINISANVTNIGGIAAVGAVISFWDGDPDDGGVQIGNATATIQPNQSVVVSIPWNITLGFHTIYAVADHELAIYEMEETNNRANRSISVLRVLINSPPNATMTNNVTPALNFTVQNFTGGDFAYTVFVDGVRTSINGTVADNASTVVVLGPLAEGVRRVIVQANDSWRAKNSTPRTIIVDLTPPAGAFLTQNGTFFRQSPLNVSIRINDTFDALLNYTLLVNGTPNVTGSVPNATAANVTLNDLPVGTYNLTIESLDDAGNRANSTSIIIYVDNTAPTIALNAPADGAAFSTRAILLNYTPSDDLDPLLACMVTLDSANVSAANVSNGFAQTYTTAPLAEGDHLWNVTCWDGLNAINQVHNARTSDTRSFGIYIAPNITVLSPANNSISNNATQVFTFNVSDETGLKNCSLLIDGMINATKTTNDLILNGTNNFTVSGLNNTFAWSVTCTDNSTGLATAASGTYNLTVDTTPPQAVILTPNATWFNTGAPAIRVNISDNYAATLGTQFYVDDVANTASTAANGALTITSLSGVANGTHTVIVQATDSAGNRVNSTPITIYVDTVLPNVTLVSPANDTNLSTTYTTLNFTASDNLAQVLSCNLTLDGGLVAQYNLTNGTYATYATGALPSGYHTWNATCVDNATNTGVSQTWRFFIQLPDFTITAGNISLSNSTPIENQTIQINATVFNIGMLNYTGNITAQFWIGDPQAGGTQLGGNITIQGLSIGENVTINTTYQTVIGVNPIYVVVDPPTPSNGTITESNETNNKAFASVWVGLFETFAGGQTGTLHIADASVVAAFLWNQTDVTGSNVFVSDTESVINFLRLQAIGRNATNGTAVGGSDFEEIDTRISTAALNDSINRTFTTAGAPRGLRNITAFKRSINNIPVVNGSTSFTTGILWDASDGGNYYDGTQDIVFVTVMNQSQTGRFGTYDYEIDVPAKLRDYVPGGGTVTFYTELR